MFGICEPGCEICLLWTQWRGNLVVDYKAMSNEISFFICTWALGAYSKA